MRRVSLSIAIGVISVIAATDGLACGDKFVVFGRGVRFQAAYATARPASILIYMNPTSRIPLIERDFQLQDTLKVVGHKPRVVSTREELGTALAAGTYDIVLADLEDVEIVESTRAGSGAKASVIPALYKPSAEDFQTAKKHYGCLVKAAKKNHDLLLVVDEVMRSRSKGNTAGCPKL